MPPVARPTLSPSLRSPQEDPCRARYGEGRDGGRGGSSGAGRALSWLGDTEQVTAPKPAVPAAGCSGRYVAALVLAHLRPPDLRRTGPSILSPMRARPRRCHTDSRFAKVTRRSWQRHTAVHVQEHAYRDTFEIVSTASLRLSSGTHSFPRSRSIVSIGEQARSHAIPKVEVIQLSDEQHIARSPGGHRLLRSQGLVPEPGRLGSKQPSGPAPPGPRQSWSPIRPCTAVLSPPSCPAGLGTHAGHRAGT